MFHSIQLQKNSTQNAPKLAFFSSKIEKFSGEAHPPVGRGKPPPHTPPPSAPAAPRPRAFGARHSVPLFCPPPCKKFWRHPWHTRTFSFTVFIKVVKLVEQTVRVLECRSFFAHLFPAVTPSRYVHFNHSATSADP